MVDKERIPQMCPENMSLDVFDRKFYNRKTVEVARDLLGKLLVRKVEGQIIVGKIVEVEAYIGTNDPAAHASAGLTKRTEVLFGEPGHAYIFSIHGYNCLNVVAEEIGSPGCVLVRALEPVCGSVVMKKLRGRNVSDVELANGPGKLCRTFRIDLSFNGIDLASQESELIICDNKDAGEVEIETTRRIGITKAADWELRFAIKGNKFVSR